MNYNAVWLKMPMDANNLQFVLVKDKITGEMIALVYAQLFAKLILSIAVQKPRKMVVRSWIHA